MSALSSSRVAVACCQCAVVGSSSFPNSPSSSFANPVTAFSSKLSVAAPDVSLERNDGEAFRILHAPRKRQHILSSGIMSARDTTSDGQLRRFAVASTQGSAEIQEDTAPPGSSPSPLQITYLENNTFLWEVAGVTILVDPVLVGKLDFGVPLLYNAGKKYLTNIKLEDLPPLDLILITQGYDDHCHKKTLGPLSKLFPELRVIATPNAESILKEFYPEATYLEPGDSSTVKGPSGAELRVRASPGPVLGPPWQRPENGYFIEVQRPKFSMYYEPHCITDWSLLQKEQVDVVVTPVIKQDLLGYTLVSGMEDAVKLVKNLKPRYVVTMKNGDLDAKGLLSVIVKEVGTLDVFKELLVKSNINAQVLEPKPGIPFDVPVQL